jgi:transposase-like protein
MPKQIKTYTPEFKQQAIELAQQDGMTISQAARDLGVSQAGLNRWVNHAKQAELHGRPAFTGRGVIALSESEKRIKELERKNFILRQEREIFKAAAKYFAKESK